MTMGHSVPTTNNYNHQATIPVPSLYGQDLDQEFHGLIHGEPSTSLPVPATYPQMEQYPVQLVSAGRNLIHGPATTIPCENRTIFIPLIDSDGESDCTDEDGILSTHPRTNKLYECLRDAPRKMR